MHGSISTTIVTVALLGFVAGTGDAADPIDKCHSGKLKESAKYSSCRLKAEAKAVLAGGAPDFSKCMSKFPAKFNSIETKAGPGICPSEGDGASIDAQITGDANDLAVLLAGGTLAGCPALPATGQTTSYGPGDDGDVQAGAALSYVDNGDGTITDANTGLMWEKKILGTNLGSTPCSDETVTCANPHHADNAYTWRATIGNPFDGPVVTIFLEQLNDRCDQDTTLPCTVDADCAVPGGACGFAGHQDWRLPNKKELESIVDTDTFEPAVAPAFHGLSCGALCTDLGDPACSCTSGTSSYWTSTTYAQLPQAAWMIGFNTGDVGGDSKGAAHSARAVRGGL